MSIDALLDDLEARFATLQVPPPSLSECSVVGFERVHFGKQHFAGFISGTSIWQINPFGTIDQIRLEQGKSVVDGLSVTKRLKPLAGAWLRVFTVGGEHRGFLSYTVSGLLVFHDLAIPVAQIRSIQIHPVDNLLPPK
jgi:hypothetical protein